MLCVNSVAASFLTIIHCLFAPCGYLQASFLQGSVFGVPEQYLKPRRQTLSICSPTRVAVGYVRHSDGDPSRARDADGGCTRAE